MSFGSNRAGVYVTPAPGERGSNRTKRQKASQKTEAPKPKTAKPKK
jgi:hypothetical protein